MKGKQEDLDPSALLAAYVEKSFSEHGLSKGDAKKAHGFLSLAHKCQSDRKKCWLHLRQKAPKLVHKKAVVAFVDAYIAVSKEFSQKSEPRQLLWGCLNLLAAAETEGTEVMLQANEEWRPSLKPSGDALQLREKFMEEDYARDALNEREPNFGGNGTFYKLLAAAIFLFVLNIAIFLQQRGWTLAGGASSSFESFEQGRGESE
ncbi:hypothetical protein QOT17_021482 [Balamuthia mandrillaris]